MSACRSCGAEIRWAHTEKSGKLAPFDAEPVADGAWIIEHGEARHAGMLEVDAPKFTSHFATCPNADDHRKKR
jgi:hypothetical protein